MYEPLLPVADDLATLNATLEAADSRERVARITQAFDETARRISAATQSSVNDGDRKTLQRLYRGMLAARRIVLNLHERGLSG
jgi:hypothetical protein